MKMELLVLAPLDLRRPERERAVMQAVIEAAETLGADRIVMRRGNVYSTGVYLKNGKEKALLYNDWDKDWNAATIYSSMMVSIGFSSNLGQWNRIRMIANKG
jgi:hypothetical protein